MWGRAFKKGMYIQFIAHEKCHGSVLENILLALFKSFRLNQLCHPWEERDGFVFGRGDLSFRVECSNQHGPDSVLTVSALDAWGP